jgi:uncharacterized membrane protein (UPF0136 family)
MHHHGHIISIVYIAYGVIVLIGGIFGYTKAQSTPSLISGIVSAIVAITAGILVPHHPKVGLGLGALVGLTLTIVFASRYAKTKNPIPAIPVGALSALVFLYSAYALLKVLSA